MSTPFSPYGYYLGRYLDAFQLCDEDSKPVEQLANDAWEVSVMVRANTPCEAYEQIMHVAQRDNKHYEGELGGISVEWHFEGVTELEPVLRNPGIRDDVLYIDHNPIRLAEFKDAVLNPREICRHH